MKKQLLPLLFLFAAVSANAQQDIFAISGKNVPRIEFNDFKSLNNDGSSATSIFDVNAQANVKSQQRKSPVTEDKNAYGNAQAMNLAALAYDASGDNLVYMPMFSSNIYVLNQKTKEITLVENEAARVTACDINSHITRMTAGHDGNIYVINNSGTQFLQIKKQNGQYSVSDLGIIQDDPSNGKNSFTAMETGFGGDMIADADNNFYVFSGSGNVFRVSPKLLRAKFIGKIKGLPETYSVNGAAVNSRGKIVVASAKGAPMYEFDLVDLEASALNRDENHHIYDLASKYFANDRKAVAAVSANIEIYPTKVDDRTITVNINDKKINGNLKLSVFDAAGRSVSAMVLPVKKGSLRQQITLSNVVAGAYLVTIADESGNSLLTKKILVTK
ncbi:secretion protein [Chryseobacterium sp. Leaf180]|uniref:T9SS type A sorting domain-containing protein n=1 Tax=Chryseobacterium sp. Leaf180 TaxID=1736289 RepID=UPI0006F54C0D|nr:T9SS type A sorting domain-containing protein [Chryseobacterium sp. Leaf180]KQR95603.1 secretion protein [Chryseobacterium sp. Leaf180]